MELRHLRYFIAAAEEEHFGRASDRLCVTRPAVSQIIADLEDELGTPLFERLAHRVKLTAAGRALLPKLQEVMTQLAAGLVMAKGVGEGRTGSLDIGYGSLTLMHPLFRQVVKQFHVLYPEVKLSLLEMSTSKQPRALSEGKIHAGFMHFGPGRSLLRKKRGDAESGQDETVLDWIDIQTGSLGVAVPNDHRLAKAKSVKLADLVDEQFVVVPRSTASPGYGPLFELFERSGYQPRIGQEVGTIASQLNLISVGVGIGFVVTGKSFAYPGGVVVLPLDDVNYPTSFVFAWVKGQKSPALERMIDVIKGSIK
ncbi:MAG: LysR family transcriptional regulator [Betaproteobacteria bacterium]|nr:LysR family transcriptional regulator [Betaproteobacteria bacterium]